MAVQGLDGCDELPLQPVAVADYHNGELTEYTLDPAEYGLTHQPHHPCESVNVTARLVEEALSGKSERHLEAILYNTGIRLYLVGRVDDIGGGIEMARGLFESGEVAKKLAELQH
jgi:anthranilate phosphoribosyltransferase